MCRLELVCLVLLLGCASAMLNCSRSHTRCSEIPAAGTLHVDILLLAVPGSGTSVWTALMRKPRQASLMTQSCLDTSNCSTQELSFGCHSAPSFSLLHRKAHRFSHVDLKLGIHLFQGLTKHTQKPHVMTFLRHPYQQAHKWYEFRMFWDKGVVRSLLQNETLALRLESGVPFEEYQNASFWRWNLMTKMLLGRTYNHRLVWLDPVAKQLLGADTLGSDDVLNTRHANIRLNQLGASSPEYTQAKSLMKELLFFGLFEQLETSHELFFFNFCDLRIPDKLVGRGRRARFKVDTQRATLVMKNNVLDYLLYEYAEKLFAERVGEMRRLKSRGTWCRMPLAVSPNQCTLRIAP